MAQVVGGFTEKAAKRIGDAVRWVESQPVDLVGKNNRLRGDRQIWAKITGGGPTGYSWTEQRRTASGFENVPDGRTGTTTTNKAISTDDENEIEADTIVRLVLNLSEDAEPYWTVVGGVQPVCGTDSPLTVSVISDVTWDEGGNGKLQKVVRILSFDSCGKFIGASEPVVEDIDIPEAC